MIKKIKFVFIILFFSFIFFVFFKGLDKPNSYLPKKNITENFMRFDLNEYLTDDILCKVDRASMFYSLESRAPFLNIDLLNFVQTIPIRQKINKNQGKIILKNVLKKYLPENLYNLPKQGFSIPLSDWIRGSLREIIYDNFISEAGLSNL